MGGWLGLLGTSGIKEEGLEVGNWLNGSGRMFAALPQSHRVTQGLGGCGVEQVAAWQDVVIMCRWTAGETGANHQMHKRIHRQRPIYIDKHNIEHIYTIYLYIHIYYISI